MSPHCGRWPAATPSVRPVVACWSFKMEGAAPTVASLLPAPRYQVRLDCGRALTYAFCISKPYPRRSWSCDGWACQNLAKSLGSPRPLQGVARRRLRSVSGLACCAYNTNLNRLSKTGGAYGFFPVLVESGASVAREHHSSQQNSLVSLFLAQLV